ncbi:glycoside hydrolase family 63 protein [Macrolepiota fuliginosa MF-IS2]|uniref:Mannosyl-oligosaccharide glucosidase n=1 Tax=Macrolepiota fuliginosa MF-IS2 TaxID=1400762 RepID=A0A9P5XKR4_9AGAR|nr:glycoside hydrolase family 63 protein [Macrolepiota fuliginosa MF-IS2]
MHLGLLLLLLPAVSATGVHDKHLWGPYRPNLYFGLRPRLPQSLMTGLMWFGTHDYASLQKTRHACEQNDNLDSYSWTEYDTRQGGVQVIKDSFNNVKLTTEFLKVDGGEHGGSWAARIKGEPIDPDKPTQISTIFYFGLEGMGGIEMETEEEENGIEGTVKLSGNTPELDDFVLRIVDGPNNQAVTSGLHVNDFEDRIGKTHFIGRRLLTEDIWQARDHILKEIVDRARDVVQPYKDPQVGLPHASWLLQLPDDVYTGSNLFAFQKSFDGPFQFDVFYESASAKQKLSSATLDQGIPALVEAYGKRFTEVFPYPKDFPIEEKKHLEDFSKSVTSNLFGGVGYFYGNSIVNRKFSYEWDEEEDSATDSDDEGTGAKLTEPKALLTATPSRSFFPRGFYWDEGFHLLHIGQWDNDFSLEILKSWIELIDENGWVAREQILGEEARSKVPAEFQTQVPNYANPPTLTMAVTAFIKRLKETSAKREPSHQDLGMDFGTGAAQTAFSADTSPSVGVESQYLNDPALGLSFLRSIYSPLKRHYDWFRRTQRGQIKQYGRKARSRTEGYRWRGRSELHVLTSGMDDYPRGPPHAGELHLDLISWMAFFTRTMREIAEFVGEKEDALTFTEIEKAILNNIEDLHWDDEHQMYCDANINEDDESYHVCHQGYLSLFPFLLELLPADSHHLGAILDALHDPEQLWSPYGIRSLSKAHPEFGQGENYWKGPIWIQMNYLALRALHNTYATQEGPYQQKAKEIYNELRKNVVNNVVKEHDRTGYVWEQYDAVTGEGKRSHPFTGWTSLTALILTERY